MFEACRGSGQQPPDPVADLADLAAHDTLRELAAGQAHEWVIGARRLALAAHWADLHPADTIHHAATITNHEAGGSWSEHDEPLAGPGCPTIAEYAVAEFGTQLRLSTLAAKKLIGHALELRHRLPRTWARVQAGEVEPWRVRRIAEATIHASTPLTAAAMAYLDRHLARTAGTIGQGRLERLIDDTITRFALVASPGTDHEGAPLENSTETHFVHFEEQRVNSDGTMLMTAHLDLADALELKHAIEQGAHALKQAGSTECLGHRHAAALGHLARHAFTGRRHLTLNLHLSALQFDAAGQPRLDPVTHLDEGHQKVLTDQLQRWCHASGATVRIQPVIDLNDEITTPAYQPGTRLRRQIQLRDQTCVFPWCERRARHTDLDHIDPYDPATPPREQTRSSNLGCLCRRHHRLKTFSAWIVTTPSPGTFIWTSPHGHTFIRHPDGRTEPHHPD